MSVSSTIATIKQKMSDFKVELVKALDSVSDRAPHADVADKLQNQTPSQVISTLREEVAKHVRKLGQRAHKVDLATLNTYTSQEFDSRIDEHLDLNSGVPFSFYGDREYLPPGITGSFESGSQATPHGYVAMMMEDNGTLMMLRSGTDGDTVGVYYSYLRNAMAEPNLANITMTNTRYDPAYFPDDQMAYAIISGSQDVIIGYLVSKATLEFTGYFVSLTNNTMDMTKHTGIVVPLNNFIQTTLRPDAITRGHVSAFLKNGYVHFLCCQDGEGTLGFRVYRIPASNVNAGNFTGLEQVTGWTVNRGQDGVYTGNDLQLLANTTDVAAMGANVGWVNVNSGGYYSFPMVREDGRVIVMISMYVQFYSLNGLLSEDGRVLNFVIELPAQGTAVDFSVYRARRWSVSISADQRGFIFGPHESFLGVDHVANYGTWLGGQQNISYYTNKFNQLWIHQTVSYFSNRSMYRGTYDSAADPVSVLRGLTPLQRADAATVFGRYGSALTNTFLSHGNIGENVIICQNRGRLSTGEDYAYYVRSTIPAAPDYQYSSLTGRYAFLGFKPTADRKALATLGINDSVGAGLLNEGDPSGYHVSQARLSTHPTNPTLFLSRPQSVDTNLNTSGTVQTSVDVMTSLRSQITNDLASRGFNLYASPATDLALDFELVIPQRYTDIPPFVVGTYFRASDRRSYCFFYTLSTSGSRQNIISANINSGSFVQAEHEVVQATAVNIRPIAQNVSVWYPNGHVSHVVSNWGQIAIRRVNGGYVLGVVLGMLVYQTGTATVPTFMATFRNGAFQFLGNVDFSYEQIGSLGFINLPNRGLFATLSTEYNLGQIDAGTKMVATLVATTELPTQRLGSYYVPRMQSSDTGIIMVSQKTVSAWTIYFAEDTPAMLDGTYQTIKQTSYDLDSSRDQNKTFHIWIVKINGVLSYRVVDSDPAAPTGVEASLYLGYLVTTNIGIDRIVCEKRTAVGGYVLARVSQGTAIPLTSGTPNNPGKLNWM